MYLANRSVFVANIPLVNNFLPPQVFDMKDTLIVGLTREAASLVDIRRNRLRAMNEALDTVYAGREEVEKEVTEAKKLFVKHGWPVIDVTRRSIEETAAEILTMLSARRGGV
jgi:regulator of PEP synthase PpsR (kinase-PPPase family)